ncbi:MAG: hypothetical protein EOO38_17810, partial [Cytophagaceae bacterium]
MYSSNTIGKYIEFDLDLALESEDELAKFVLAFSPKSLAIGSDRSCLLDIIRDESLASWQHFTKLIEERANKILLELINGFYLSDKNLGLAKENAYDLLYKCLFSLYIESKKLLPFDISKSGISSLRQILFDMQYVTFKEYEISSRLSALFKLYKDGNQFLPKGFGGEHFEENSSFEMKNIYLKNALELLTVFEKDASNVSFFDFSSLNVELLGDVYE